MNAELQKCVNEYRNKKDKQVSEYTKKLVAVFEKILPGVEYKIDGCIEYDGFLFMLYNENMCKNALFCKNDGTANAT